MKKIKKYIVICFFTSFFIFSQDMLFASQIKFFIGDVKIIRDEKRIIAANGYKLKVNDIVTTGAKSLVIIEIYNSSVLKINENSKLVIRYLSKEKKESSFNLLKGSVFSKIFKQKRKVNFSIIAQTIVASVRGTEFYMSYGKNNSKNSDLWLCVNEGAVNVHKFAMKKSKEVIVKKGEGIFIKKGSEISDPKKYKWTKELNWNMDPLKGEVADKTNIDSAYTDILDQDYD